MENFLGKSFKQETSGHRMPAPVADTILSTWPLTSQTWSKEVSIFIMTDSCKLKRTRNIRINKWKNVIRRLMFRVLTYNGSLQHPAKVFNSFLQQIHTWLKSTDVGLRINAVDFRVETQKDVKVLEEIIRQRRLAERT